MGRSWESGRFSEPTDLGHLGALGHGLDSRLFALGVRSSRVPWGELQGVQMAEFGDKSSRMIPRLRLREVESDGVKQLRQLLGRFSQANEQRQNRLEASSVHIPETRTA